MYEFFRKTLALALPVRLDFFCTWHPRILAQAVATHRPDGYLGVLLYTFGLLLVLFLLMNLDRRFREYMGRSLVRPFNFFADIRDRRLIPNSQTVLLAFVLSGSLAISVATMLRGSSLMPGSERYLHALLPGSVYSPAAGLQVTYPELIIFCTAGLFVMIVGVALILRFWAIFVRGRYSLGDTYNIAVWSLTPLSFLLAYDLVLPRLDATGSMAIVSTILVGGILLWSYARTLKGMGVLFDIYPTKIYGYGILLVIVTGGIIVAILQK